MQGGLEKKVLAYIEAREMIRPGDTVFAAVSGGADSVCLLLLLLACRARLSFRLRAVHVEHGIRGEQSLEDARFVEALCREKGVALESFHVDAPACARERGLSLEEAARELRYEAFSSLIKETKAQAGAEETRTLIALAHHSEDQAETVLFNLARGTGLRGIGGMRPVRGACIRPMLELSRGEIEDYLRERGQAWREDSTNADTRYARNRLRLEIMPALEAHVNAQTARHLCDAARKAAEAADYLEAAAEAFCGVHMQIRRPGEDEGGCGRVIVLDNDALRGERSILREYILRRAVFEARGGAGLKDVGEIHIRDLTDLADKPRGKRLDLPGRLKALREGRTLVLYVEGSAADRAEMIV